MTLVTSPTRDDAARSVAAMPRTRRRVAGVGTGPLGQRAQFGDVWRFEVAAGLIRLREYRASDWEDAGLSPGVCDNADMTIEEAEPTTAPAPKRGNVDVWSRKSRANMLVRMASLDYAPLFAGNRNPVMLTLTLPKKWEDIAPDNETWRAIFKRFMARYEHAWGHRMRYVWKREFQRRGAPHLHILMTPPEGRTRGDGLRFAEWVGPVWAQSCLPVDYDARVDEQRNEYRDHALHGVERETVDLAAVDAEYVMMVARELGLHERIGAHIAEGGNLTDPLRIAAYFAKHGLFEAKAYQNAAPDLWREGGKGVGRYWGMAGLEDTTVAVDVSADDPDDGPEDDGLGGVTTPPRASGPRGGGGATPEESGDSHNPALSDEPETRVLIGRAMRHLSRVRSYTRTERVWRWRINYETGEVRGHWRRVTRRVDHLSGRSKGFLVVNNGPQLAEQITRHVVERRTVPIVYGPLTARQSRILELRARLSR